MAQRVSSTTTDHETIRRWVEERGGWPAEVAATAREGDTGIIRVDFPGFSGEGSLQRISWDEWFRKFDESGLAFVYEESTAGGQRSNFNKLVSRETAQARAEGRRTSRRGGSTGRTRTAARGRGARTARAGGAGRGAGRSGTRARKSPARSKGRAAGRARGGAAKPRRAQRASGGQRGQRQAGRREAARTTRRSGGRSTTRRGSARGGTRSRGGSRGRGGRTPRR
jgi:hypothetical protein